jgi:hypothetical protein
MQTSESIKEISTALVAFHKEVDTITKDAKNPFYKSSYATLSNVLGTIDGPLVNNGLSVVQFPEGDCGLSTRLCHKSGEYMEATYIMKPVKMDPQGLGSAITYARRYSLCAILSLAIDDDDDGNHASGKTENKNGQAQGSELPWLNENSQEFSKAVAYLKEGKKISAIEAKFRISKKVRELLLTNAA